MLESKLRLHRVLGTSLGVGVPPTKGRCQNTFPVTTGSPHRPTPPGGGVNADLATQGGQF
jgi:hypothetical protein